MHITDVRTTALAVPLTRVFRGGTYEITARCTIITEILTDTGLSGCTYAGDERARQGLITDLVATRLKPLLLGQDPLDVERLWDQMFAETIPHGDRATILQAIAAVDIARTWIDHARNWLDAASRPSESGEEIPGAGGSISDRPRGT